MLFYNEVNVAFSSGNENPATVATAGRRKLESKKMGTKTGSLPDVLFKKKNLRFWADATPRWGKYEENWIIL